MPDAVTAPATDYVPPKVWTWDKPSGGKFASINRPIAGATQEAELPVGEHPLQRVHGEVAGVPGDHADVDARLHRRSTSTSIRDTMRPGGRRVSADASRRRPCPGHGTACLVATAKPAPLPSRTSWGHVYSRRWLSAAK